MSSCWATRRASSTSDTLQHPVSLSPPHSRIVTPTTSWPSSSQQRGGDRRVDAAAHRHHHLHRRRRPRQPAARALAQRRRRRRSTSTASSTSASVVVRPSVSRSAPVGPRAARRPSRRARATAPSPRWRTPTPPTRTRPPRRAGTAAPRSRRRRAARAPSRRPWPRGGTVSRTPATPPTRPSTSRSRSAAMRADLGRPLGVGGAQRLGHGDDARRRCACRCGARAPARRRRSAARAPTPSRTASTPTPFGPPNLWALSDSRSTCGHSSRRSSQHAACTASVWSSARGARPRTTAATAARSVIDADLVVDGHHADDGDVVGRAPRRARRDRPGRRRRRRRPCRRARSTAWSTAWCSAAGHTARPPWRRTAPAIAALSLSVPPPVNTTSPGRQPMTSATRSRASSTARRGVAGEAVRAARVGEALGEERQHRLDRALRASASSPHGRGRRAGRTAPDRLTVARSTTGADRRRGGLPDATSYGDAFADVYDEWYAGISDVDVTRRRRRRAGRGIAGDAAPGARARRRHRPAGDPARRAGPRRRRRRRQRGDARPAARRATRTGGSTTVARRHGRRPARRAVRRRARRLQHALQPATDADRQAACFAAVAARLAPGGAFVVEAFVPEDPPASGPVVDRALDDRRPRSCCRSPTTIRPRSAPTASSSSSPTATACGCGRGRSATHPGASSTRWRRPPGSRSPSGGRTSTRRPFDDDSPRHVSVYARRGDRSDLPP